MEHRQPPQEQTRQAVRGMPDDYHHFDATTDRPVTADDSLRSDAAAVNASGKPAAQLIHTPASECLASSAAPPAGSMGHRP